MEDGPVDGRARLEQLARGCCGAHELSALTQEMRNHLTQPGSLPPHASASGRKSAVELAYERCAEPLQRYVLDLSRREESDLRDWLPWVSRDLEQRHLVAAILEEATFRGYYELDHSVFNVADANAPLFLRHPALLKNLDSKGLLHLAGHAAGSQALIYNGLAIPYHQFLRRNFSGTVNYPLVDTLLAARASGPAKLRLALDEQHFMPAVNFSEYFEHDYWRGRKLSGATLDDPHAVGVTVHGDPNTGITHQYPRLIVSWNMNKEGQKVVEIEEFAESSGSKQGGLHLLRYLHAIRDIQEGCFVHCDGAVRAFTPDQYASRTTKEYITGRECAAHYRKVFRLDGRIETSVWSDIAAQWYRGNRLMIEYLETISG